MTAVEYLSAEHRRIEELLVALETVAIEIETSGTAPAIAGDLLDCLQQYADVGHHAKEEILLFPALERHGIGPEGIVDAITHQHELGRIHIRDMRRWLELVRLGEIHARGAFAASAHAYLELLRVHIQIEDENLYPIAAHVLTAEENKLLLRELQRADDEVEAVERFARWEALVARIHEPARH